MEKTLKMIVRTGTIDEINPLFREYLHHTSQFFNVTHYENWVKGALKNLKQYSIDDDRHVYIISKSDSIIGFGLVNKHFRFNSDGFAIADFGIQKNHWEKGYGRKLAEHIFAQFHGNWEVAVTSTNYFATIFWENVISSYTNGRFIKNTKPAFKGFGLLFNNV
jgi:predicted acetyltransferase